MSSITARLIERLLRAQLKPTTVEDDFVAQIRGPIGSRPLPLPLGRGVAHRPVRPSELDGVEGEWVGVPAARRRILYAHGGYYIAGTPALYRALSARLARGCDADVLAVDYRLAPEHPYPAGLDDVVAAYRALLGTGVEPASVAVAGDSAGGGLTLALLLRARHEGLPMPGAAVLLSPWVDLTCTAPSLDANDDADDMLTAAALRRAAGLYAGDTDPSTPGVSPLLGDLSGLPPLFVTVDGSETLLDDAVRLVERAQEAGVSAQLHRRTGLFHVWPVFAPVLVEARQTVGEITDFLDRHLAP